jgi:transcriptional regulator with XRE-family HTH domain
MRVNLPVAPDKNVLDHGRVEMHDVMRQRRNELGLSQADLAAEVGTDSRQIRRYEAGETQPTLPVAKAIARALGISLDELAGGETRRVDLSGPWWACWQSWKDGAETINPHQIEMRQQRDVIEVVATTRGARTPQEGAYLWRGELRVFDNEALMGWYVADEGAVRSRGTLYFALHQHGTHMVGRWVGLSYDGPVVTGWGAIARTQEEVTALMDKLRSDGPEAAL